MPTDRSSQSDPDGEFSYRVVIESSDPDTLSTLLSTLEGYRGVQIVDQQTLDADETGDPEFPSGTVVAFFAADSPDAAPDLEYRLRSQILDNTSIEVTLQECRLYTDESWREEWKEFFDPVEIAPDVWVGPPWESDVLDERTAGHGTAFVIDPGMAFGTGHHETTRLSATLLSRMFGGDESPGSVLDVGCGSGVLTMLAADYGAEQVVGIDISDDAIDAARENARRNDFAADLDLSTRPLEEIDQTFDLVVANILADILLYLRTDLFARVAPGGTLLVSGITDEQRTDFLEDFLPDGWEVTETSTENEWVAYAIRRSLET
jgi:ribosomal protein L11 methyltransferase